MHQTSQSTSGSPQSGKDLVKAQLPGPRPAVSELGGGGGAYISFQEDTYLNKNLRVAALSPKNDCWWINAGRREKGWEVKGVEW